MTPLEHDLLELMHWPSFQIMELFWVRNLSHCFGIYTSLSPLEDKLLYTWNLACQGQSQDYILAEIIPTVVLIRFDGNNL